MDGLSHSELKGEHVSKLKLFSRNTLLNYVNYMNSLLDYEFDGETIDESSFVVVDGFKQDEKYYGNEHIYRSVGFAYRILYNEGVMIDVELNLQVEGDELKAQVIAMTNSVDKSQNKAFAEAQLFMTHWLNEQVEIELRTSYANLGNYSYMITSEQLLSNDIEIDFTQHIR